MARLKRIPKIWWIIGLGTIVLVAGWLLWNLGLNVYAIDEPITALPSDCQGTTRFAVVGDYGDAGQAEADVAALIDSWDVDFIVTVGDNNYPDGQAETIDQNIGQYYESYIYPYVGNYGPGDTENRFYPAIGNHDWDSGKLQPYLDYFTLPGNERYYELEDGPVQLFILDSDPKEPDGRSQDSVQAGWLEERMSSAAGPWRLVFLHHAAYSSALKREGDVEIRWPYAQWGADAVISGHDHFYERLEQDGIPYIINGLGGRYSVFDPIHRLSLPIQGSKVRYNQDYGAMLVTADDSCINFSFFIRDGELIDSYTLYKE
ncbi:MAG: metallophosphoesterase [Candidatus Promineifilaceae bacterium]